jgi:hypothetical protein
LAKIAEVDSWRSTNLDACPHAQPIYEAAWPAACGLLSSAQIRAGVVSVVDPAEPAVLPVQSGQLTTYPIHAFWQLAARCGFEARYVELVPEDEFDERYAYFFLVKPNVPIPL